MSRTTALSLLFAAFAAAASAQEPQSAAPTTRLIPFSGVLTAADATAVAAAPAVTFSLFDEREGGTLLWTETQTVTMDSAGRYTAHLGSSAALPLEIFRTEQARWLEVSIDGRAQPRVMLVAVPYALRAADAETLGGKPLSEFVLSGGNGRRVRADGTTIDDPAVDGTGVPNQIAKWSTATTLGSSILTESFDNRLGVLAPDPTGGGAVDSIFTIRNPDNNTALGVLNSFNQRRFALNTLLSGGWTLYDGGDSTWNAGLSQVSGRTLVGTTTPEPSSFVRGKLEVRQPPSQSGLTVRKAQPDTFDGGIHVRSAAGVPGPLIKALAGLDDGSDSGGNYALFGRNENVNGVAVRARADVASGIGIHASGGTLAGQFTGNVTVSGTLTKGGGAFQIDHPLDPENKYLRHSFVESPDMMNVYNGNVVLDDKGQAWIDMPDWFEALNRDFRYQLTAIGAPGPNLHVAAKLAGNRFRIAGGTPGAEVSWQVTGIRQDAWANAYRIEVEQEKPGPRRGTYLHPEAFGLSGAAGARPLTDVDRIRR